MLIDTIRRSLKMTRDASVTPTSGRHTIVVRALNEPVMPTFGRSSNRRRVCSMCDSRAALRIEELKGTVVSVTDYCKHCFYQNVLQS
jgi:hypothetical protein